MRRNTVTMLKYTLAAAVIVFVGPVVLRSLSRLPQGDLASDADAGGRHDDHKLPNEAQAIAKEAKRVLGGGGHGGGEVDIYGKKDWHDWAMLNEEQKRQGPGEGGQAVIVDASENQKKEDLYRVNGFNALASDKMALDRSLRDIRHADCRTQRYLAKLPNVSVVIPFHNEHWTTLLRTVVTVMVRSPPHLLHEVILADDGSTKEFLGKQLEDYVKENYGNKVKVVRHARREGLIRTRIMGAKHATGEVLLFLDSHCEANVNFLPPLLEPIAEDYKTVTCPLIDVLDHETFAYRAQDEGARGAFDWEFLYKRLPLTKEDLKHPARPFASPVMAGGLFAISTKWFWELGGYDPELMIWGGEQYELSFKIWQCHGRMVDTPCSRIGHVYRKFAPFPNPGIGDFIGKNFKRVAEVWMDEYAEYLYKRKPSYRAIDAGDMTEQRAVRSRLKCKPFHWFMKEVAFDLESYYPTVEPEPYASGEIRSAGTSLCIDTKHKTEERFGLSQCLTDNPAEGGEQDFLVSWHKDIRLTKRTMCLDVSTSVEHAPVILYTCHGMGGNQLWKYDLSAQHLYHPISNQCLDCNRDTREIFMNPCDPYKDSQKWTFGKANTTALAELWQYRPH